MDDDQQKRAPQGPSAQQPVLPTGPMQTAGAIGGVLQGLSAPSATPATPKIAFPLPPPNNKSFLSHSEG